MDENKDVLVTVRNGIGRITLNRPKAINSLTHPMVTDIAQALKAWETDDAVTAVIVSGAGDRGLCAGGDVVAIYHDARAGGSESRRFWHDEYLLNAYIGRYPKPYVAIMNGITMGGGVGISAHGSVRVVTETTKMAMPEVGIGFIPDVGGTFILSRTPGLLGVHAALTGAAFSGADAIAMGFADHFVPQDRLAAFADAIEADGVDAAVAAFAQEPPPSALLAQRDWIDHCYAGETVADIVVALRGHDAEPAIDAAELIESRSPVAASVTLEAVRRAAKLDTLEDVLRQEFRTSVASLRSHDLVEGIRALLIDKDKNPQWSPASLSTVTPADIEAYFAPADPDLTFDEE
ncbi:MULTISPECIES: enoyl-CoA hydratase/isomerase family protein [Mycolicibacterium]|uniref:3-hydroxyisobutyryl-CoA hydrolase n=1 Tax=Mycolicibacterium vanbaalenii (strain DSM 7251 / JCM 13017 / BCRC 16820 / KCTC 9966 / NRRL B-24157 / PYR-1) TaxID=350058 RepID=A1TE55_MYCVP|nr:MULTISPECIES: enoyl-CoA hydratase/isomerase family protein [Mycolicibacterium]ABM15455.1 Enoyl-CoA hydratase/isomerase [Mycolicibacterium vanbaalenii PYR-1]MCV7131060.1 enoyl-CoA hydratase/isomerase family protein [Mycolicibacterium vanbaalenii PYR-1]MDW5612908.1 enoyl-CoA hydratase/isomerase family protein [Mycolicibacterium sp. D5.8-2]